MTDLHLTDTRADQVEIAAVEAVLGNLAAVVIESDRLVRGGTAARRELRHLLLPSLHALQNAVGWISPGGLNLVADRLQVPPAEAYGVATFYDLFRTEAPEHDGATNWVCTDIACRVDGEPATRMAELETGGQHHQASPCLGQCERAGAAVFVQGRGGPDSDPGAAPAELPQAGEPGLRLLARIGRVDPTSLDSYVASGGYKALARALAAGPDGVIGAVTQAGLSGRGGAAFPTGVKWRGVRDAVGDTKHVVVNADESEPGTFKDRFVLENDPFALVEAATIAAYATGATKGWIYVRGEYPVVVERLEIAMAAARQAGFLGDRIARSQFSFDLEIRRGAGAYICGEETALFNSIEGFRGEPRQKPPFPSTNGLFDQPTAINNPETLLNVLPILIDGADAYRSVGTGQSPGTRLFCVSGRVARPGVYEHPFGVTLGEVIERAGGVAGSVELRAVLLGGAAGSFVGPDQLDLPLTLEDARATGTTLGSGVVMVFDAAADMADIVNRIAEFFRHESCGQCVPCRIGTQRQVETLVRLGSDGRSVDGRALVGDLARAMADASICGLGHTAASAVQSALALGLIGESS
ncbi:MAG: NADH-quinone oxidoreductase subunit E [Actinomycetia bacterium]|nr:NADH-quinone oxidoreductase subunit E [Actinomycetes bacterium]